MSTNPSHSRLAPGDRIDRFTIHGHLGQGENAEVYRAFHPQFKRDVAIKIFHPEITRTESLTPVFVSQTKEIIALKHPNIMRVLESGMAGNSYYIVMELFEGTTLRDELSTNPRGLERDTALRYFQQIASAIAYAHEQDIIHGNIKPDNILLDKDKRPVLTDFNIPCFREHPSGRGGAASPAYLASEQLQENQVSVASDIFALGLILYEMLTGDVPFKGVTRNDILRQHQQANPTPPSEICIGLNPRIDNAIMTAIKQSPADRFTTVRDMLSSIENESLSDPFETVSLTREDIRQAQKQKRAAEIRNFERSRTATESDTQTSPSGFSQNPVIVGAIVAGVVIVFVIIVALLL